MVSLAADRILQIQCYILYIRPEVKQLSKNQPDAIIYQCVLALEVFHYKHSSI